MDFLTAWNLAGTAPQAMLADEAVPADVVEAQRYLAAHRDQLPSFVYVRFPGPEAMDVDDADGVYSNSLALCHCGLRRLIVPTTPRFDLRPGTKHAIGEGESLAFTPWGGDYSSTFGYITVVGGAVHFRMDPFATGLRQENLHIGPGDDGGFSLAQVHGPLVPFLREFQGVAIVVGQVTGANADAKTVTIVLDECVRVTDMQTQRHFLCHPVN